MSWYKKSQEMRSNGLPLNFRDWPIEAVKEEIDQYIDEKEHELGERIASEKDRQNILDLTMRDPDRDYEGITDSYMGSLFEAIRAESLHAKDFEERAHGRID